MPLSRAAPGLRTGLTSAFVRDHQHTSVLCQRCFYRHLCTSIALLHCSQQPLHGRPTLIISEKSGHLDAN